MMRTRTTKSFFWRSVELEVHPLPVRAHEHGLLPRRGTFRVRGGIGRGGDPVGRGESTVESGRRGILSSGAPVPPER